MPEPLPPTNYNEANGSAKPVTLTHSLRSLIRVESRLGPLYLLSDRRMLPWFFPACPANLTASQYVERSMRLRNAATMLWLIRGGSCPEDAVIGTALEAYVNGTPLPRP